MAPEQTELELILFQILQSREKVQEWLNTPHPDLSNCTPISLVQQEKTEIVYNMLVAALFGQSS
jgi:uncharacterized protein (DUF2384 family)